MDRRRLYRMLDPDSPDRAARLFRVVHHVLVALGIAAMLADSVPLIAADYDPVLRAGYYLVGAFFVAEYVLRLIVAPEVPRHEHHGQIGARLHWAVSLGGLLRTLLRVFTMLPFRARTAHICRWVSPIVPSSAICAPSVPE